MAVQNIVTEDVHITKLVHGGQALATLANGKKVFVWNALPGETVRVRIIKQRRSFVEAIAEEIKESSPERIEPREINYLATSPWQMMTFDAENNYKRIIVEELFSQHGIDAPKIAATVHDKHMFQYRNKMEYSFWGDDDGLHLAMYRRGSHGKQIVNGSELAIPFLDTAAHGVLELLEKMHIRAGDLKTIIVRCNQAGDTVASLYVKPENFPDVVLPTCLQGLRIYHSNPKSPASVPTKLLHEYGDCVLQDVLSGQPFAYDGDSFFQVNVPVFELALRYIVEHCHTQDLVDMYAGVGSIGLSVAARSVNLIELDPATAAMARINAHNSHVDACVIEASSEKSLEYITGDKPVMFDPPRAGLHEKIIAKVLDAEPPTLTYLSCNPATQARDLSMLQEKYAVDHIAVFNFFPRTPHIETLAILSRKA